MEILNCHTFVSEANEAKHSLSIKDGELRMGGKEFRAGYLLEWQRDIWDLALKEESHKKAGQDSASLIEAVAYALSLLRPGEWILPDELSSLLKIFCYDIDQPDPGKVVPYHRPVHCAGGKNSQKTEPADYHGQNKT